MLWRYPITATPLLHRSSVSVCEVAHWPVCEVAYWFIPVNMPFPAAQPACMCTVCHILPYSAARVLCTAWVQMRMHSADATATPLCPCGFGFTAGSLC